MSAERQGKYQLCLFLLQSRAWLVGPPHARRLEPCEPSAHLQEHCRLPQSRLLLGTSARPQSPGACCPPGPSAKRQPPLPRGHPFPRLLIQPWSTARPALPGLEEALPCLWGKALLPRQPHPTSKPTLQLGLRLAVPSFRQTIDLGSWGVWGPAGSSLRILALVRGRAGQVSG